MVSWDVNECLFTDEDAFPSALNEGLLQWMQSTIPEDTTAVIICPRNFFERITSFKSKFDMWRPFHSSSEATFARASWFQDHPLLAAPCRWDHHLCTDLKEEGKIMDNAVRRTRSYKYVI